MRRTASDWQALFDRLAAEEALAPPAAVASDVADHYDRTTATLLGAGDAVVLAMALARVEDATLVRQAAAPHDLVEGGYGKSAGLVSVGDKARFLLKRLLGPARAAEAIAAGPAWLEGKQWHWDAKAGRFK